MVRALENPISDPTYLEFFGFTRPPFAQFSRPPQIFHTEQYSLLTAHLANATEKSDRLVVIYGVDGSGKTTLLTQYINNIGDDICFVAIDETCKGEKQFYCALLRQIGFGDITGTPRELRSITKEFVVQRGMAGDPVLMIVDNAHLISPTVLEQLRWISAIKVKDRRVLSVVLAGNSDLARVMDSPAMTQIEFRNCVDFHIRVYSETETADYVCHHLKLAGGTDALRFPSDAHALIYRYTGGVPRLINMLCNAVLAEAHALESHAITEDLVRGVADKRRLLPHVVPLQGRGRRRTDPDFKLVQPRQQKEECITAADSTTNALAGEATQTLELIDIDGEDVLERIGELSEQIGELRADRMRALQDVGARDKDISELRNMLDQKTAEAGGLASALGDSTGEIERLNQALSDSEKASQKKEKTLKKHTADLKKEKNAAKTLQANIAKSKQTANDLGHLNSELQAAASVLTADLKLANERLAEHDDLEKNMAALADENDKTAGKLLALRDELDARDATRADLENLLQESQGEISSLRSRTSDLDNLEESVSGKEAHIASLNTELAARSEELMALEAKYEELESHGMELTDAEHASTLESELQESQSETASLRSRVADLENLEESVSEKEAHIASLNTELAARSEEFMALEAKYEELESRGAELTDTVYASTLASELQEVGRMVTETQVQVAGSGASTSDSPAEQCGTVIVAFEVSRDGETEQVLEVAADQSRIVIGRSEDNELRLDSKFVSRHHALLQRTEQGFYIEDLNSFNGTNVNSKTITRCELRADDLVEIGNFQIRPKAE